jgi:hypothetical protein
LEENKKFYITSKYAKTHIFFYHFSNTFWNKIATNYWWPINNPCRCIFCQYISIFRHIKTGWKNFKNSNFEIPTFWPILCQKNGNSYFISYAFREIFHKVDVKITPKPINAPHTKKNPFISFSWSNIPDLVVPIG